MIHVIQSVILNAKSSMICLYWMIGKAVLDKQKVEGWRTKIIDRKVKNLNDMFPELLVFSLTISSICAHLLSVSRIKKLCNGSLHEMEEHEI